MRTLAVIPARGGSKGLPRKNVLPLGGEPLIAHTIRAALAVSALDRVIVSTDDEEISAISRHYGAEVPFMRPAALATDGAKSIDVAVHALEFMEAANHDRYDALLLLQPTCPLRAPADIEDALALYEAEGADSVISLKQVESMHPYYMYRLEGRVPTLLMPEASSLHQRQEYPAIYWRNGAIYLTAREVILEKRSFYGERLRALVMPPERSVNIDADVDLAFAGALLAARRSSQ